MEHLVSLGADVNKVKNDGGTPLRVAAWNGQLDTVKYLISEGAVVDKQDNNSNTALHDAAKMAMLMHFVDFLLKNIIKRNATNISP